MITGADSLTPDERADSGAPHPAATVDGAPGGDAGSNGIDDAGGHSGDRPPPSNDPVPDGGLFDAGVPPKTTFLDDFARPDGTTIGNGWIPKVSRFSISSGAVLEANNSASYKDLLVHRPGAEAALDVEISMDATLPSNGGDVCLFARVQPASDTSGSLVSYTFYPGDYGVAYLDRDVGSGKSVGISSMGLSPPLVGGQTIHMMLRVTGTSPVHLVASISDTSGRILGSLAIDDTTASPIVTAGTVGFGSGGGGSRFDNFRAVTF